MVRKLAAKISDSKEIKRFLRFQFSAVVATSIDFLTTIILKEFAGFFYPVAVACGASAGACSAFTMNRYWVFQSIERHPLHQGARYLLVAVGSIILNTSGTFLVTEYFHAQYLVSKAIVALVIGFTYSYYFSKRFVFYA